jgi:hypothetical protein
MLPPSMELYCTNGLTIVKRLPYKIDNHDLMLKLLFEKALHGNVHGVEKPILHIIDNFNKRYYNINNKRVEKDNLVGLWLKEILDEYTNFTQHYATDGVDIKMSCILKVYRYADL